jgi:transcriptional regulator with XRE-family HTH domain
MTTESKPLSPIVARLETLRTSLDLTHDQTAAFIGVSPHTLRKYLYGEREPATVVSRLLDVLDLVQTLAPALHSAMVQDVRDAGKAIPKNQTQLLQKFSPRVHTANLVDGPDSDETHMRVHANLVDSLESAAVPVQPAPADPDDVLVWPDETWCYRRDSHNFTWLTNDYRVLSADTPEWAAWPDKP